MRVSSSTSKVCGLSFTSVTPLAVSASFFSLSSLAISSWAGPADVNGIEKVEPVYAKLKGWQASTEGTPRFEALPQAAQDYLRFLEAESGAKIGMVSTGPDRDQTMTLPGFAEALHSVRP